MPSRPTASSSDRSTAEPDPHVGADAHAPGGACASRFARVVRAPDRSACGPRRLDGDGVGRPRGLRLEEAVDAGVARELGVGARSSRRATCSRSASSSRGELGERGGRDRRRRPRAGPGSGRSSASIVAASNRSVLYSNAPSSPRRRLGHREGQVELGRAGPARRRRAASSVSSRRPTSGSWLFWRTNITWKSGVRLGSRRGLERLDEPLERQVLVLVGRRAPPRGPGRAARGSVGSPERSARRTSMLTK